MSARYADISDPRDAEVPDMPDLRDLRRIAGGSGGGGGGGGGNGGGYYDEDEDEGGLGVAGGEELAGRVDVLDVRDLEQEEFDPDACEYTRFAGRLVY